ncbi:phytanoyl-CoA dioxygenase family protein [Paenibacillus spongiae]|uniref:Phytanoyl-CoA dioxygenase family protein n=1 Tax=Paenibacillus spongiae TaxID=2909671 RepID=A0ABY5S3X2_9BACL|nr:phytanoyl-CoA dioxygenase family protein [Paenibacillus spongiae]UVI27423.1 phytanoyl-CoA dioxygenase family protein [Paenibacillus spongiae]
MLISHEDVERYQRDGYLMVEGMFNEQEVARMIREVEQGERVATTAHGNADTSGRKARLAIWFDLNNDMWSDVSIAPRLVNGVRILLGEDAAFYHGKVMLKEAQSGGAWEWHQDYGYWYGGGFIYPNMISVFIALDEATKENGCLRVLRGSHKLGRLEHGRVGQQTGADANRIQQVESLFDLVDCEMKPGTALFFHSNLLHSSRANESPNHRRSFIVCYNATANPQLKSDQLVRMESCPVGTDNWLEKHP